MSNGYIQLPADSTGKKLDTETLTVGANSVHRERIQLAGAADVDIAPIDATAGLKVNLGSDNDVVLGSEAAEGAALPSTFVVIAGDDGADTQPIQLDGSGRTKVTLDSQALPAGTNNIGDVDVLTMPGVAAEGAALPSNFVVIAGDDGTDTQPIQLNAAGDLKVTLDGETVPVNDGGSTISVDDAGGSLTVDVGAALPAGDNNIGNVDLASAIPSGSNLVGVVGKSVNPYDGASVKAVQFAPFSAASAGSNTIVAAQGAGNAVLVLSVVLVAAGGANTCTWKSATTDISGDMSFAENGGYSIASEFGVLKTADNEALALSLSAATAVEGHITYIVV